MGRDVRRRLHACLRSRSGTAPASACSPLGIDSARSRSAIASIRDGLAFASEPSVPGGCVIHATPDPAALKHFLALQYVPAPQSAFAGVQHLRPAHLTVDSGGVRVERYWRLRYGAKLKIDEIEALNELERRLTDATRRRLIADVPLARSSAEASTPARGRHDGFHRRPRPHVLHRLSRA